MGHLSGRAMLPAQVCEADRALQGTGNYPPSQPIHSILSRPIPTYAIPWRAPESPQAHAEATQHALCQTSSPGAPAGGTHSFCVAPDFL